MSEVVLPRRVIPQPRPFIVPDGDCGACVLGGLLGLSIPDTYDRFSPNGRAPFNYDAMETALGRARRDAGLLDRLVSRPPHWNVDARWAAFGPAAQRQWQPWAAYLRMAFDAGYYGVAEYDLKGRGVAGPGPDHWVMLCGWREDAGGSIRDEILVSCSAHHPEGRWMDAMDLVTVRGCFNTYLARPA